MSSQPLNFTNPSSSSIILKILLLGDTAVGKSSIISRYTQNEMETDHKPTVGVELRTNSYCYEDIQIKEQIWDLSSMRKYETISVVYYKGAHGAFLVYDITSRQSFNSLQKLLPTLQENSSQDLEIMIIGNKVDLEYKREVSYDEAKAFATQESKLIYD